MSDDEVTKLHLSPELRRQLKAALLEHPVRVERSYLDAPDGNVYRVPAGEYLTHCDWFTERRLVCPESPVQDLPESILDDVRAELGDITGPVVVLLHLGYPGSASPLHFDWDFRQVAHINISGFKHFHTAPPNGAAAFPTLINSIPVELGSLDQGQMHHLLGFLRATSVRLRPGAGIRFPPLWWHAAHYTQPSLSVSVRYAEVAWLRPIAALPRSAALQRLASLLRSVGPAEAGGVVTDIVRAFLLQASSWQLRRRRFHRQMAAIDLSLRRSKGLRPVVVAVPPHLDIEGRTGGRELRRLYGTMAERAEEALADPAVQRISAYLFEEGSTDLDVGERLKLARYALHVRQGLPPRTV